LTEAYELLEQFEIQRDCVPLLKEPERAVADVTTRNKTERAVNEASPNAPDVASGAGEVPVAAPEPVKEGCMFIHRMPVIMSGGEVMACAVPHAAGAGKLGEAASFAEIWNGDVLRSIRGALNTANEWPQCRTCHYREARVSSQQALAASGKRFDSEQEGRFSEEALNFLPDGTAQPH
jgi:hypothetical protein